MRRDDRCDRCGAQAFVRVTDPVWEYDLLFCGHHFARFEHAFEAAGWGIEDHRNDINQKP